MLDRPERLAFNWRSIKVLELDQLGLGEARTPPRAKTRNIKAVNNPRHLLSGKPISLSFFSSFYSSYDKENVLFPLVKAFLLHRLKTVSLPES